jgi:Predicted pPIWI-associating nuclease
VVDLGIEWQRTREAFDAFATALGRSKSVNINSKKLKAMLQGGVQQYFRQGRPELINAGLTEADVEPLDTAFQELLRLSNGNNKSSSYRRQVRAVRGAFPAVAGKLEMKFGAKQMHSLSMTGTEAQVFATLAAIVPSAAASYQQALQDLRDANRISFRGTAAELREALREVLDHLAPDDAVMKADGFKLEKDRNKPTQRQKVHFLLKARGHSKSAISSPQDAIETFERGLGELARSVYTQGSLSTHVASSHKELVRLKRYIEVVLQDVLEL